MITGVVPDFISKGSSSIRMEFCISFWATATIHDFDAMDGTADAFSIFGDNADDIKRCLWVGADRAHK